MCRKYLHSFCDLHFHSLILCFGKQEFLILDVHLLFPPYINIYMLSNKNPVLQQGNEDVFYVTSKCIFNLPFTIKSIIQLLMIF